MAAGPETNPELGGVFQRRSIEERLKQRISLNLKDTALRDAIDMLRHISRVTIVHDAAALEEYNIGLDQPVSLRAENISLQSALDLMLRQLHLTYVIWHEVILITVDDPDRPDRKAASEVHRQRSEAPQVDPLGLTQGLKQMKLSELIPSLVKQARKIIEERLYNSADPVPTEQLLKMSERFGPIGPTRGGFSDTPSNLTPTQLHGVVAPPGNWGQ